MIYLKSTQAKYSKLITHIMIIKGRRQVYKSTDTLGGVQWRMCVSMYVSSSPSMGEV